MKKLTVYCPSARQYDGWVRHAGLNRQKVALARNTQQLRGLGHGDFIIALDPPPGFLTSQAARDEHNMALHIIEARKLTVIEAGW